MFTLGWFLLIGIRGSSWQPVLFLAVPIVVVFFSYLYCNLRVPRAPDQVHVDDVAPDIADLVRFLRAQRDGRSHARAAHHQRAAASNGLERRIANQENWAQQQIDNGVSPRDDDGGSSTAPRRVRGDQPDARADARAARRGRAERPDLATLVQRSQAVKTVLPKTSETIALLNRYLISAEEERLLSGAPEESEGGDEDPSLFEPDAELTGRIQEAARSRGVAWIVGTSLLFEAFVLGACVLVFTRRDF